MNRKETSDSYNLDSNLKNELDTLDLGVSLGHYLSHGEILECRQFPEDRLQQTWFFGKTGTGKSNLFEYAGMQDINQGNGITFIDPHGKTADRILAKIPPNRLNDVVLADFSNTEYLPIINLLNADCNDEAKKTLVVQTLNALISSRMPEGYYGPRGEELMRLRLETIMDPGYPFERSITEVEALSINDAHLGDALKSIKSTRLVEQWNLEKRSRRDSDWDSTIHWFLSKIHEWVSDPTLRFFLGGGKTTIDIEEIIENGKILIVKIPEALVGTSVADFIGSYFVALIKNAIMKRCLKGDEPLRKHYVYIDEFQRFATPDFAVLLAEARKFGCGFILANQNIRQLIRFNLHTGSQDHSLLEAVLGNVGTIACFRVGANDARVIADQFDIDIDSVRHIGRYKAMVRLLFDNRELKPVVVSVPLAPKAQDDTTATQIRKRMVEEGIWRRRDGKEVDTKSAKPKQSQKKKIETVRAQIEGSGTDTGTVQELADMLASMTAPESKTPPAQDKEAKVEPKSQQADSTTSISWDDLSFLEAKRQDVRHKKTQKTSAAQTEKPGGDQPNQPGDKTDGKTGRKGKSRKKA
ncbi:MAG: type IV secretory system conjugative DNA transfer family protein [Coriobacteriales bacterium]|nr:type IV secretory system conjugative DNA transfer family protein [Coriobacteriales bacterium]